MLLAGKRSAKWDSIDCSKLNAPSFLLTTFQECIKMYGDCQVPHNTILYLSALPSQHLRYSRVTEKHNTPVKWN